MVHAAREARLLVGEDVGRRDVTNCRLSPLPERVKRVPLSDRKASRCPCWGGDRPGPHSLSADGVTYFTSLVSSPSPLQSKKPQRPEPGFAAVDPEFWDVGTLSEADGQLLIHPLHLLWRKEIGVCEPLEPDSPCLTPVGSQLEGARLPSSAGGWHLQHHLQHRV